MSKQKIVLLIIGALLTIFLSCLIFWQFFYDHKNTTNYSVTEITGDCEKNTDNNNKDKCYQKLFVLYNSQQKKDCTVFPGSSVVACEKAQLVEEALTNKSESGCEKLENENEKLSCEVQVLYGLAISTREVKYCEKIKQTDISADCRAVIDKITAVKTNI